MSTLLELPAMGIHTRADFAKLPEVAPGWAWELRSGRLELTNMPVTMWHWKVVSAVLEYWRKRGHEVGGEQYVADSGFIRGGTGVNNFVADGVVFIQGYEPDEENSTHDAVNIHVVVEAVSRDSEERDAIEKRTVYATLGIPHYWIIRKDRFGKKFDGLITMYDLTLGEYTVVDQRSIASLENG